MPWTIADVEKHKKGLSNKQKEQWIAVANSVLAKCKSDGGNDETCAPSAIRQANGSVGTNCVQLYFRLNDTEHKVRTKTHEGKKHLILPVTMMVEGVHNGSQGAILHQMDELGHFPDSWNGRPIVINHPKNSDGVYVSANNPDIIDSVVTVGKIYNTQVNGSRLQAEAWLVEEKLQQNAPEVLAAINGNEPVEVSVGVFTDNEPVSNGDWNGEEYTHIARNHRPDHLALLPGGTGACSVADGCGMGVNKKGGNTVNINEALKVLNANGFSAQEIEINKESFNEIIDAIRQSLNSKETKDVYSYVEDIYDDSYIYSTRDNSGVKMYSQKYLYSDGSITNVGDPIKVTKKVDINYTPVVAMIRTKFNNNKKEVQTMAENKECGKCMEKVVEIINTNAAGMTKEDRNWLILQEETVLDKILSKKPAAPVVNTEKPAEVKITSEQIMSALSEEDNVALAYGKKQLAEKKASMIKGIQDNTSKEIWPDAVLAAMKEDMLERIFNSVKKEEVVDYSLNAGGSRLETNAGEVEPLMPTGVELEIKK